MILQSRFYYKLIYKSKFPIRPLTFISKWDIEEIKL